MTDQQKMQCHAIIHAASAAAGGVGAGLAQIPGSDNALITPIQLTMTISLGKVFGKSLSEAGAKAAICGRPIRKKDADVDHIIPQASGGSNDASNLCISCQRCNRQKGNMDAEDYAIWKDLKEDEEDEKFERDEEEYGWIKAIERMIKSMKR